MIPKTLAAALIVMVGACSTASQVVITKTHDNLKAVNDTAAAVFLLAPCAMTKGAFERLTPQDKIAVDALNCGTR